MTRKFCNCVHHHIQKRYFFPVTYLHIFCRKPLNLQVLCTYFFNIHTNAYMPTLIHLIVAECTERAVDDYLKAAFGTAASEVEKKIVIPSDRPSLYQPGPLVQYIPTLHFPWMPYERPVAQSNIIYST